MLDESLYIPNTFGIIIVFLNDKIKGPTKSADNKSLKIKKII